MGYETKYKLKLKNSSGEGLLKSDPDRYDNVMAGLDEINMGHLLDEPYCAKWYGYKEDMLKISTKYPDVIFELSGVGENDGDMWCKYFLNGKYQEVMAQITYAPFDEKLLK